MNLRKWFTLAAALIVLFGGGFLVFRGIQNYQWKKINDSMISTNHVTAQSVKKNKENKDKKTLKVILESELESELETKEELEIEDNNEVIDIKKIRDEQLEKMLEEHGLSMSDYVNNKEQISKAVLTEVEEMLKEYDDKIKQLEAMKIGPAGEPGKDGKDGRDGKDGKSIVGPTGATGLTGATGATGAAGKDGISSYIRYAPSNNPKDAEMTMVPDANTKYIGNYEGNAAGSQIASNYIWSKYVNSVITYEDDTVHIVIN